MRSNFYSRGSRRRGPRSPKSSTHDQMKSVYFTDNNGIALEASYWVIEPTGRPMDVNDDRIFADPDPVPSVAELAAGGLTSVPTTSLV